MARFDQTAAEEACGNLAHFVVERQGPELWHIKAPDRSVLELSTEAWANVKKLLKGIGGVWKGGKTQAFAVPFDPSHYIEEMKKGRKLNLKSLQQFFATPPKAADELTRIIPAAGIHEDIRVLEPHAGDGAVLKHFNNVYGPLFKEKGFGYTLHAMERDPFRRGILKGVPNVFVHTKYDNYLSRVWPEAFDYVMMNPPFAGTRYFQSDDPNEWFSQPPRSIDPAWEGAIGLDIEHLLKSLLDIDHYGGVAAITSPSWTFNHKKVYKNFRELIGFDVEEWKMYQEKSTSGVMPISFHFKGSNYEGEVGPMPKGSFKESGAHVDTIWIRLNKYGYSFAQGENRHTPFNPILTEDYDKYYEENNC